MRPLDHNCSIGADTSNHNAKLIKKSDSGCTILDKLTELVTSVPDSRRTDKGNIRHKLSDVILLTIFARMSGCVRRADIIGYGRHHLVKFQKMGMLKNGVPSEPTLCRIENGMDNAALANKMQEFAEFFQKELMKSQCITEIICVDGKAERGTIQENGRNPDIVSAYSYNTGIVLATEACQEKSNEIKAVPLLIDKIDIKGKIVTADAMSMQKNIIDKIKEKGGDFLIELKANQRALRYGVEDRVKVATPLYSYTSGPELAHGRIETRTYRIYNGKDIVADKEKWGAELTIVECESDTITKSTGERTFEKRFYVTSLPAENQNLGSIIRSHWSIESMHWGLDRNLSQDNIKRKSAKAARNLDTTQRIVFSIFSIWKGLRKKVTDKKKGMAKLMREVSMSFTKLKQLLSQK